MERLSPYRRSRQAGSVAVEFALIAAVFFAIVFAAMELARIEYLVNTLEETTRRAAAAAANTDYRDAAAIQRIQAGAVFRNSPGPLGLGDPVASEHVRIDYLWLPKASWDPTHMSTLPACPAGNRLNCLTDPNASNCIRFVRARVCASVDDAGNCERLPWRMVFPFLDLSGLKLPSAETIVPAGSLGAVLGAMPCT